MAPKSINKNKSKRAWDAVIYDIFLWIFTIVVDLFFREIHPRSTWRIPRKGPVIFVAAPHANQFVDPLILMRTVRQDAHRRISFLIAEKSMRRKVVGFLAGLVGSVPVGRALDSKKPAKGKIYLPDPEGDACLVRGTDVDFTSDQFMPSGLLVLPSVNNSAANAEIKEIVGPNEIRLKKPFKGDVALKQLTGKPLEGDGKTEEDFQGVSFSVAPHVDQSAVYDSVFARISEGGCIGIFPEGGSHDRTDLLPLKAGLAVMALGALAQYPDCNVTIVPVGMNYFHPHKFRSRCVIEFGSPISVSPELIKEYKEGVRRDAVGTLLTEVQDALKLVTVQAPDFDTLMLIQAVRRLYNPKGKKLPLPAVIELQRRFLKGYEKYKDRPRIVSLRRSVLDYHKQLMQLNIRDHQVSYAKLASWKVFFTLIYRIIKLAALSIAVIPGFVFFSPVFIAGKIISRQKSKEALAASTVKIKANDVVATWKIMVSLALAPALDIVYTIIGTYWTAKNRVGGRVPDWIPLWVMVAFQVILFPTACFAALRFGEIGMDIFKSIRPLVLSLNPGSSNTMVKLRNHRATLQEELTQIVNELGPELFPDFDQQRIIPTPSSPKEHHHDSTNDSLDNTFPSTSTSVSSSTTSSIFNTPPSPVMTVHPSNRRSAHLSSPEGISRNDSFSDIRNVGLFATRPDTPNRSRSRSRSRTNSFTNGSGHNTGEGLRMRGLGMTTVNDGPDSNSSPESRSSPSSRKKLEDVSRDLHAAMRERGRNRRRKSEEGWVLPAGGAEGSTTASTPTSETSDFEPEEAKKDL